MFYSDIVKTAELIAVGTATKSECRIEEGGNTIRTYVTFDRVSARKGNANERLVLRLDGGVVGEDRLVVAEMPQFKVGATYLLYVAGNGTGISPIVGFNQGAFEIQSRDGREVLLSLKGLELIGVDNDRFVFAGRPGVKPVEAELPQPVMVPGFVPRRADASVEQKEQALLQKRAAAAADARPLVEAPILGNAKTSPLVPSPAPEDRPAVASKDASPIVVPAAQDRGIRADAASLLSTVAFEGRK
jgi:hypothetical protein